MKIKQMAERLNSVSVRKKAKRILAITLAVLMANPVTGYGVVAHAQEAETITAFAKLSSEIATQQLAVGAEELDINLPNTLDVTLSVYGADTAESIVKDSQAEEIPTEEVNPDESNSEELAADESPADDSSVSGNDADTEPKEIEKITSEDRMLTSITWQINAEYSGSDTFDSESTSAVFYYEPVLPEGYILADGISLPQIKVQIEESSKWAFSQSTNVDGVEITVKAEKDVFPKGAVLHAEKVTNAEDMEKIENAVSNQVATDNADKTVAELVTFDITITDAEGNELQPDTSKGEVRVSFAQLPMVKEDMESTQELKVFHMDESMNKVEGLDTTLDEVSGTLEVSAEHFSLYPVALLTSGALLQSSPMVGDGTEENPYQITTLDELEWCIQGDGRTAYSVLKADITVTSDWNISSSSTFTGTFDGGGHTIDCPSGTSSQCLFSEVAGVVRNLHVSIEYTYVSGGYMGVICHYVENGGLVENCFVSGNFTYDGTSNTYSCGGICASLRKGGTVRSCLSTLKIKCDSVSNPRYMGSLIGSAVADCSIENCYALDTAFAYAIGKDSAYTKSDTVTMATTDELKSGEITYMLNGYKSTDVVWYQTLDGSSFPSLDITQKIVYAVTERDCPDSPPKGIGYNNTAAEELPAGSHDYDTATGLCKYCGHRDPSASPNGDGTEGNPYEISTLKDLYWFWDAESREDTSLCAKLTENITVNTGTVTKDTANPIMWTPIGTSEKPYMGTFDSNGYNISGLYCTGDELAGLFGVSAGTIKNVKVENSYFYAKNMSSICAQNNEGGKIENCSNNCMLTLDEGNGNDSFKVGGVCVINNGTMSGCTNNGDVTGKIQPTELNAHRYLQLGGVCGYNNGNVTKCVNNGAVTVNIDYTANGIYKINFLAGGICGENQGALEQSANEGAVNTVLKCDNGCLSGNSGGICGKNGDDGIIRTSYNTHSLQTDFVGANVQPGLGGISGYNTGLIEKCFNAKTGALTGTVQIKDNVIWIGGICGISNNGKLKSSYNMANVSEPITQTQAYNSICGQLSGKDAVLERCFGLTDTSSLLCGIYNYAEAGLCEFKTEEQFKSGEVAYLLNGKSGGNDWYQNIDVGTPDDVPVLDSTHGVVYYNSNKYFNIECQHTNADPITGFCPDCKIYSGEPEHGEGTAEDPYQLENSKNLYWFSALIGGQDGIPAMPDACAVLANDITVNAGTMSENSSDAAVWMPLGTSANPFIGSIDGQGHTVSGLYFNDDTQNYIGFVGCVDNKSSIQNVTIANSYFNGKNNVGAICGGWLNSNTNIDGLLTNCHTLSNVKVSGELYVGGIIGYSKIGISNCKNRATVSALLVAGGIIGISNYPKSDITKCENYGDVTTEISDSVQMWRPDNDWTKGTFAGGIIGAHVGPFGTPSNISNCLNKGTISIQTTEGKVAGIAGIAGAISNDSNIINCYNTGTISAPDASDVGGIVGTLCGKNDGNGVGLVKQCHNAGQITGASNVGGVIGNYKRGINEGTENCFSLTGTASEAVGYYSSSKILTNVSVKTAEEFQNGSLIEALNGGGSVWEQGTIYPIFMRTELDVSGVNVSGKDYDGKAVSYSGTPVAELSGVTKEVAGFTYIWQIKEAENVYKNISDNIAPEDAGSYRLVVFVSDEEPYYKGNQNIDFTIEPKTVSKPTIVLEESSYTYTGDEITPSVTVKDGATVIPDDQYEVSYKDNIAVGNATITITAKEGANYTVSGSTSFAIKRAGGSTAPKFSSWDNAKNTFTFISTSGKTYKWRINDGEWTDVVASGTITTLSVGNVTIPAGKLEVRTKATETQEESESLTNTQSQVFTATLEGSVTINNMAPSCGDTLIASVSGQQGDAVLHYQWKAGNVNVGTDENTYVVQDSDIGKTITVLVTGETYDDGLTSAQTSSITASITGAHDANVFKRYIDTSKQTVLAEKFGIKIAGTFTSNGDRTDSGSILQSVEYGENITFALNSGLSLKNQTASIPVIFTPENSNYIPKALMLTVTLTSKEPIEITGLLPAENLIYNGSPQSGYTGTATVTGNKVSINELVYTYTGINETNYSSNTAPTDAGSYMLIVSIPSDNDSYVGQSGAITFTIAQKQVTVKADNKNMTKGSSIPYFSVSYSGFIGKENDNNAALDTQATASCPADGSVVGTFTINITTQAVLNNTIGRNYIITSQSGGILTVQNTSSGGSSSGGSSGGGGGASSSKTTETGTHLTVPVSSNEGSVKVEATVKDGIASFTMTDKQINEIVADNTEVGTVKIDVSALDVDTAVLPTNIIKADEQSEGSTGIEVILTTGSVTLDKTALTEISAKGSDVTVSIKNVDNSKLSEAHKKILGSQSSTAVVVDVTVWASGEKISVFAGGKLAISVPYTPKANEDTSKLIIWFITDEGMIEPKQGTYNEKTGCFEFTTDHLSQYVLVSFPFTDVVENSWYYGNVAYAYMNGLFSGTSEMSFSPDLAMTRQMIWMVLARMDGKTPTNMDEARKWAVENGISDGSNPTSAITREQMSAILYRYASFKKYDTKQGEMTVQKFDDYNSISEYAKTSLNWAVNAELIKGSDNNLMPNGDATRAQVAAILMRFNQSTEK